MTVPFRGLPRFLLGLLAIGLVLAGLSVEAFLRLEVHRAQRALPGALAHAVLPDSAPSDVASALPRARRDLGARRYAETAAGLEALALAAPTPALHALASRAWMAADRGLDAARHAQLAARLAPGDAARAASADRLLNAALAFRARPFARIGGAAGGLFLLLLLLRAWSARRARRELGRYLDDVSARMTFLVDGEPAGARACLPDDTDTLTIDVHLSGRYGMACPPRPSHAPTLYVSWSHAAANRTLRMTPIRRLCDSAVRIPVRPETLRRLLAVPGRWRVHLRLGTRPLANAVVDVRTAAGPLDLPASRRNGALTV